MLTTVWNYFKHPVQHYFYIDVTVYIIFPNVSNQPYLNKLQYVISIYINRGDGKF